MRNKKALLAICVLLLVLCAALWMYWERQIPMIELLPDEDWVKLEMSFSEAGTGDREMDPPELGKVLEAIGKTNVTRGPEYKDVSGSFRLALYKGEGYPTVIYVAEDGKIAIAAEMDVDNWRYYEGGEELYEALLELTS